VHADAASADEVLALAADLADAAVARGDWASAAVALQDALKRTPRHIPTLLRLVEIGVDGGLDGVISVAQAELADAYLDSGSAAEARFIVEDLIARHPEDPSNVERLMRALTMLGEADPDAVITNLLAGFEAHGTIGDGFATAERLEVREPLESSEPLEALEPREPLEPHKPPKLAEVDLTIVLDTIKASEVLPQLVAKDLDAVFAELRDEASQRSTSDVVEQDFGRGMALYRDGQVDDAVAPLESASRAPARRFEAATTLGRIFLQRGQTWHAIEWLERAAEAPAPTPEESHRLLYELADALEAVGEVARALAICLELRAEAGDYQDVAIRVDRLTKVQAGG
jgi:tetratricopeptide (TPR) repeat protein